MADLEDLLFSPKPDAPRPSDCCGTGCVPCVHDIYEQDLKNWTTKCENLRKNGQEKQVSEIQVLSRGKYSSFEIIDIKKITPDTFVYGFKVPDDQTLGLTVGQHVIVHGVYRTKAITRSYTPINDSEGKFELLIKIYPDGKMSSVVSEWEVGSRVQVRGPFGAFAYKQNSFKRIVMLAAGTGIAPMFQVCKHVLSDEDDFTKLHLMYASKSFEGILLRDELYSFLSYWNFTLCHYLSREDKTNGKKYSETVELRRLTKKDVEVVVLKGSVEHTLVLVSGTKSFDKDVINALLDIQQLDEKNIFKF